MSGAGKKIFLLLFAGIGLGYAHTPRQQWKILKETAKSWKEINEKELREKIRQLYRSKMIEIKEVSDGVYTVVLTKKGRLKALTYHFDEMKVNKGRWDGKWRLVIFDIPEKLKNGRDALRDKLKSFGFYELQKSVFVVPYECRDEIDFIVEFFNLRKYVRFGILESVDNELHLKKIFKLI